MFELPEFVTLAGQINATLTGKTLQHGCLGNSPHKFVWYNRSHDEFAALTPGLRFGRPEVLGRWLLVPTEPGFVLVFGEFGGRILLHPDAGAQPAAYHFLLEFEDRRSLSLTTAMWGAMELHEAGRERERQYIRDMRVPADGPDFTAGYLDDLVEALLVGEKRSVKALLTQEQLIPGIGNSTAQEIMFAAGLHPKRPLASLDGPARARLHAAIVETVAAIAAAGGRSDEVRLLGTPGGYERRMSSATAGHPCPVCGTLIARIQYLGGACCFCPACQPAWT